MSPFATPPAPGAWAQLHDRLRGPRVFRKNVREVGPDARAGGLVAVRDGDGEHLGWALFHPHSQIALRLLSRTEEAPGPEALAARAQAAAQRRLTDPSIPDEVCRVIHGEADGFPGLLVDRYGPILAAEAHSLGSVQRIRPGQLNWMTAGRGISHAEEGVIAEVDGEMLISRLEPIR